MSGKLRILGIVPYEDMKQLMLNVVAEYPQIEMDVEVGDMEDAGAIARRHLNPGYDLILSRGGIARLLQQQNMPVLDVDFSPYDILRALRLSNTPGGKIAMVVNAHIGATAQTICDILGTQIDIIQASSIAELDQILTKLQKEKYTMVLSDFSAHNIARHIGLNSMLITSGPESIRQAIQNALLLHNNIKHLQEENLILRQVLNSQKGIAIFSTDGELLFSSLESPPESLMEKLRNLVSVDDSSDETRYSKNVQGTFYAIRCKRIHQSERTIIAFYVEARRLPSDAVRLAVHFSSRQDAKDAIVKYPFSIFPLDEKFQKNILDFVDDKHPLIIGGEYGTEPETLINQLFVQEHLQGELLITINCALVNDKCWKFLLEHQDSPLIDSRNVILFSSVDSLSTSRLQQLISFLNELGTTRNRLVFSCRVSNGNLSTPGRQLLDRLGGLTLTIPTLHEMRAHIPTLFQLTINHLNGDSVHPTLGANEDAIHLLQEYTWPHNYMQFCRVVKELSIMTTNRMITKEDVRTVLNKEMYGCTSTLSQSDTMAPLDLSKPLHDIDREIIIRVVKELGGNQTAAAARLEISRTTLWRFLRKE